MYKPQRRYKRQNVDQLRDEETRVHSTLLEYGRYSMVKWEIIFTFYCNNSTLLHYSRSAVVEREIIFTFILVLIFMLAIFFMFGPPIKFASLHLIFMMSLRNFLIICFNRFDLDRSMQIYYIYCYFIFSGDMVWANQTQLNRLDIKAAKLL